MLVVIAYFLASVNYSVLYPEGGGPQILGSCADPDETRIAQMLASINKVDENMLETSLSFTGDPCDGLYNTTTSGRSKYAKLFKKRLPEQMRKSMLNRAPPMEQIGEAIRKQSDGVSLNQIKSMNMDYADTIHSIARELSNIGPLHALSGFEFIHVARGDEKKRGIWHADPGPCPRIGRIVSVLEKDDVKYGNIDIVLPELIEKVYILLKGTPASCSVQPRKLKNLLTRMACNVELDAGDVFYFAGNVYHRTSDNAGARISIQVSV